MRKRSVGTLVRCAIGMVCLATSFMPGAEAIIPPLGCSVMIPPGAKPEAGGTQCDIVAKGPSAGTCMDMPLPTGGTCTFWYWDVLAGMQACSFTGPKPVVAACVLTPGRLYHCKAFWSKTPLIPTGKFISCV